MKQKKSYQFESDRYLMSPSWDVWSEWDETTSLRQKQMYFDSKMGNLYHKWHLHMEDVEAFERRRLERLGQQAWFRLDDPYMLVSVRITKDYYHLSLLKIGAPRTFNFKTRRHNLWHAELFLKV